ncbi:MAG: leucine-rich repeat protein [Prevotella sp.]|nr:leucine-rich repeat protein [Prevotella sp.]
MKKAILTMFAALLCAMAATAEVIDGISYRLSKNQTGNTAAVKRDSKVSYSGELIIPPTVTYDGETYTVTAIDSYGLQDISMVTKLSLPATVTYIASNNFIWKNSLESITVAEGNPTYDSRGGCNAIIETRENKLVAGCTNTVIPEGIIYFADGALGGTSLETIVIPKSVVSIGEDAFSGCEKLTTVTILGSLAEGIDEGAFSGCRALTDIYLYAETPPSLDSESFGEDGIEGITLHVPATAIDAYNADDRWSRNCESIVPLPATGTKGDADGNGKVDIADVAAAISYILDPQTVPFDKEAADMDGNGSIDINDVKAIVAIILK